jgi:transcriptional regulator with GAF, ATPase, and Fis domain
MLQQRNAAIAGTDSDRIKSMDDNERDNIVAVLRKTNGKIFGKGGAAEFLGVSPSTLNSRIRKLGISKERIFYK